MNGPSITVVTVALNAAADLPLTIESVLAQSYSDIEYLIIDGLSYDETYDVAARYAGRVDRFVPYEDGGIYQAMNFAAEQAQGEFVLFLNAGDRFYCSDAVESVVERGSAHADIFYGDHIYKDGRLEQHVRSADFGALRSRLLRGNIDRDWHLSVPAHQATFTRTALLRELAYDTRYSICADHEFLLRAADRGARLKYVDEIVAHYVAGGMSGAQGVLIHREWAHAYRKHSMRPLEVDRFLFQSTAASPFPSHTSFGGIVIGGAFAEEVDSQSGCRWRWANRLAVAAPSSLPAVGLVIKGASVHENQILDLFVEEKLQGSLLVGDGEFEFRCAFLGPVLPGQTVYIQPQIVGPIGVGDHRDAGWGFEEIHFLTVPTLELPEINLPWASEDLLDSVLIEGWCKPDGSFREVRSQMEQPSIALDLAAPISRLGITCSAGPHAAPGQQFSVLLNGELAGIFRLAEAGSSTCEISVGSLWRDGPNVIRLCLEGLVENGGGVALQRISWS